jgi:hypothetical protein
MKRRCLNPKDEKYPYYGGRGIKVCDRWILSFEDFLSDVGLAPSDNHSLDRYPNLNGHYEPGNVRWATGSEQQNNTRKNNNLTYQGETLSVSEWSKKLGIGRTTINWRINKGLSIEEILKVDSSNSIEQEGGYYYELFKFFSDEHNLTLVDTEIQDIIHAVKAFEIIKTTFTKNEKD